MLDGGLQQLLSTEPVPFRPLQRSHEAMLIVILFIMLLLPILAVASTFHPRSPALRMAVEDAAWPHWGAPPLGP